MSEIHAKVYAGNPNKFCKFLGCNRNHLAYGYCGAHYQQYRRGGELIPLKKRGPNKNLLDRITKNVKVTESSCWEWLGAKSTEGYAVIVINKKRKLVHMQVVSGRENTKLMYEYHNLRNEILRLRKLVVSLGGDPGELFKNL